jgi:hypothetical protein
MLAMPTVANGIDYDYAFAHARAENLELVLHDTVGDRRPLPHPRVPAT